MRQVIVELVEESTLLTIPLETGRCPLLCCRRISLISEGNHPVGLPLWEILTTLLRESHTFLQSLFL